MVATNRKQIQITGGIFIELMAKDVQSKRHTVYVMVYISPCTNKFYFSRDFCKNLVS